MSGSKTCLQFIQIFIKFMKQKVGLIVDSLQVSKQFKILLICHLQHNMKLQIIVNDAKILSSGPRKKNI